jgi:hypothetical protein
VIPHVVGKAEHNFWSPVPPSCDIFGHEALVAGRLGSAAVGAVTSGQPKVTDLEFAIGIDEKVARFEIPVKHIRRMDVFQTAKGLIQEGLKMGVSERLSRAYLSTRHRSGLFVRLGLGVTNNGMKIRFHQFLLRTKA